MITLLLSVSHALCMCLFHHSPAKITNPWTPIVFIHFGLATSLLPTLHSFPTDLPLHAAQPQALESGPVTIATTQKDTVEERREMLTYEWRVGASQGYCFVWLAVGMLKPRPPHCVMIIITSAAKPVTAAAAARSLSVSLCLLSHCKRCPCVEVVLSLSKECYKREDSAYNRTSARLSLTTHWQEHRKIVSDMKL